MKYKKPLKITQRTTSVTNGFVQALIPWVAPLSTERDSALKELGMTFETMSCAYCGGLASDWDHLRPLVRNKRPTGYISDYKNMVPACGRCNQSKGASIWSDWIVSKAAGSPKTRGIEGLEERIAALHRFEAWGQVTPLNFEDYATKELWNEHWNNHALLVEALRKAQEHAYIIQAEITEKLIGQDNRPKHASRTARARP